MVGFKRSYVQHRVKDSIKPEALITRIDRRVEGWVKGMGGWVDGWMRCGRMVGWVSEVWARCGWFMKLIKSKKKRKNYSVLYSAYTSTEKDFFYIFMM